MLYSEQGRHMFAVVWLTVSLFLIVADNRGGESP